MAMVSYRKPGIKNLEGRLLKYQLLNKSILFVDLLRILGANQNIFYEPLYEKFFTSKCTSGFWGEAMRCSRGIIFLMRLKCVWTEWNYFKIHLHLTLYWYATHWKCSSFDKNEKATRYHHLLDMGFKWRVQLQNSMTHTHTHNKSSNKCDKSETRNYNGFSHK